MKVLAFNSSPSMANGNTALILNPFLQGMKQAGADVELFYTKKLNIRPCQGDLNCWLKSPGDCYQQDDMQMLHPKLRQADVLVLATPVYSWGVSGPMKNLMDRLIPLIEPWVDLRDDHCSHPLRESSSAFKIVLVSTCGFFEMDNFEPLLVQFRMLCKTEGFDFAAALLRPAAPIFAAMLQKGLPVDDIPLAANEAGRQLVEVGHISHETLSVISREVLPREEYMRAINSYFEKVVPADAHR